MEPYFNGGSKVLLCAPLTQTVLKWESIYCQKSVVSYQNLTYLAVNMASTGKIMTKLKVIESLWKFYRSCTMSQNWPRCASYLDFIQAPPKFFRGPLGTFRVKESPFKKISRKHCRAIRTYFLTKNKNVLEYVFFQKCVFFSEHFRKFFKLFKKIMNFAKRCFSMRRARGHLNRPASSNR